MIKPELEYRQLQNKVEVIDRRGGKERRYNIRNEHLIPPPQGLVRVKMIPRSMMGNMKTTSVPPQYGAPVRSQSRHGTVRRTKRRRRAPQHSSPRLGDQIETALSAVGVTKTRWLAVKSIIGLPETCSCKERLAWLNRLDEQLELGEKMQELKKLLRWGRKNA